ncbi:MAG: DUF1571 domain-containing protein [Deltaproteobacteria bacterium]|nr:DUF1571 domain-containing protein [Deltaproteobacteria bacterium]MBZ0219196.1 DUF1571 domain-containing protein [Deltaproteobacteria bacterium]
MLFGLLAVSIALSAGDPVDAALESFRRLEAYSVTLRAESDRTEVIRYFYKKPGYIRMEFEEPHRGAVLIYDPLEREVLLRPFRFLQSFKMRLEPEDRLIRSSRGHTVDESSIGTLLENVSELKEDGSLEVLGEEDVDGKKALLVEVEGRDGREVDGINMYRLWLDQETRLPVKVEAYDAGGKLVERVRMDGLVVDPEFPPDFFSLD